MFKQLNVNFNPVSYIPTEKKMEYGKYANNKFFGIQYFSVLNVEKEFWGMIPEQYHQFFRLRLMEINTSIPPHTDSGILVTINCYVGTMNARTTFYERNLNASTRQVANQTNGYLFDPAELIEVDSFVANEFETWILDVTYPHSIKIPDGMQGKRKAISLQTNDFTYSEVLEMLKETGSI